MPTFNKCNICPLLVKLCYMTCLCFRQHREKKIMSERERVMLEIVGQVLLYKSVIGTRGTVTNLG